MSGLRRFFLAVLVSALIALPANAQETVTSFSLSGHGGFINDPSGFDADRSVSYGSGVRFGGGVRLQLYERISIRGDASFTSRSGTDTTGGINESVSLGRQYFGGGVEVLLATGGTVEPYVHGGGGLIIVDRQGATTTSYSYDVTEFTGVLGAGARYVFESNAFVFADATSWIYSNHVTDEAQVDMSVSVGLGYRLGGN